MKPLFGYYFTTGRRWGGSQEEVADRTNLDVYGLTQFTDSSNDIEAGLRDLRSAVKWSTRRDRRVALDLDVTSNPDGPWRRVIKRASKRFFTFPWVDPWESVALLEVGDEPSAADAAKAASAARSYLSARGLRHPPIGVTMSYQAKDGLLTGELDWVGFEAYLDPMHQNKTETEICDLLRDQLTKQAERMLRPEHKIVVVIQAYARNGGWTNMTSLRWVQRAGYDLAKEIFGDRCIALKLFSWRRPTGTFSLPSAIRIEHGILWDDLILGPEWPTLSVDPVSTEPKAEDYISMERARTIADEMDTILQELIWYGARHFERVLAKCPSAFRPGGPCSGLEDQFLELSATGNLLYAGGSTLWARLLEEHKKFPGRSRVRKVAFSLWSSSRQQHLATCSDLQDKILKGDPRRGVDYDNIMGACDWHRKKGIQW